MTDWLVEKGIGETRFARIEDGEIVEAKVLVDGVVPAGTILSGKLVRSGTQLFARAEGQDYLLPDGAAGVTDGAPVTIEVTREIIPGWEDWKRPLGRVVCGEDASLGPLAGQEVSFPAASNPLSDAGWDELIEEARSGIVRFEGGELRIFPTPAMTLIDVDGALPPDELALRAAQASAKAIVRLGIGGSIGIDFPTVKGKTARAAIDEAIDDGLPKPFERTSLNGFGFLQIVRPRRQASLIELAQDRAAFEARALLRRVAFDPPGPKRLVSHPALIAVLGTHPDWIELLSRQVGGQVTLRSDASLPIHGAYAETP